jgi:hypothetical protein
MEVENREEVSPMEKRYYNAESLRRVIDSFEERFHIDSETFYAAHYADDQSIVGRMPRFVRHTWASFYREWQRIGGDDFAETVKRELELA